MEAQASPSVKPSADYGATARIPGGGKFWISDVDRNHSVTIRFAEWEKGKKYVIYLCRNGTNFREKYKVGEIQANKSKPAFNKTVSIPKQLRSDLHIAVLVITYSDNSHGYTIFENTDGYDVNTDWSLNPIHRSSSQTTGKECKIYGGLKFWIKELDKTNDTITIKVTDYDREDTYTVLIGENSSSFQGLFLGKIDPTDARTHTRTYDIPAQIRSADELRVTVQDIHNNHSCSTAVSNKRIYWEVIDPYGSFTVLNTGSGVPSTATPFTNIIGVVQDSEVTLQTYNFPADKDFVVTMGPLGTKGVGGFVIGTQNSGVGGSFVVTYPIPAQLWGSAYIAIRLQSTTSGHFAYDYFENASGYSASSGGSSSVSAGWTLAAGTYPYTQVTAVVKDGTVTFSGFNFTKYDTYTVTMGPIGSKGVGGFIVAEKATGASSTFTETFTIPAGLYGADRIAIRFQSQNTPYYAYDWFYNSNLP